ncbi:hypothetical protein RMSM_01278 [Rhodopirellula maiorica SM1]|uniref:Ricin B lectin domain-containing protein n=2 Tax=Novipirellula TaxID=2795426 RepID=M5S2F2_9BACT|nr:hypothetical protein RMSM_01278 [Rhodopirellula maiorica SM1]
MIYNRQAKHRIKNDDSAGPETAWIRRDDVAVQWLLRNSGNGTKYIQSANDGKLLRWNGSQLDYAPADTTGDSVEWSIDPEIYGWHNISSALDGKFLQLLRTNNSSGAPLTQEFQMVSTASSEAADWWFAKPYIPAQPSTDFGDAPAPYPTLVGDDGAAHEVTGPRLGDTRDGEFEGHPAPTPMRMATTRTV